MFVRGQLSFYKGSSSSERGEPQEGPREPWSNLLAKGLPVDYMGSLLEGYKALHDGFGIQKKSTD